VTSETTTPARQLDAVPVLMGKSPSGP